MNVFDCEFLGIVKFGNPIQFKSIVQMTILRVFVSMTVQTRALHSHNAEHYLNIYLEQMKPKKEQ